MSVIDLPDQSEKLQICQCSSSVSAYPEIYILFTAGQQGCFIIHWEKKKKKKKEGYLLQ